MKSHRLQDVCELLKRSADLTAGARAVLHEDHRPLRRVQSHGQRRLDARQRVGPGLFSTAAQVRDRRQPAQAVHDSQRIHEGAGGTTVQVHVGGRQVDEVCRVGDQRVQSGLLAFFDKQVKVAL